MTPDQLVSAFLVYGSAIILIAYLTNRPPACPRCGRRGWKLAVVPACVCDGRPRNPAVCLILAEGWR